MKRLSLVFLFFAALGMTFLGGCSNEEKLSSYENAPQEGNTVTFILPMVKKGTVTYGETRTTGLDSEYEIENLFIYWFIKEDGTNWTLNKIFSYGAGNNDVSLDNVTLTASNKNSKATIQVGTDDMPSRFYFLANVNGSTAVKAAALNSLAHGTAADVFKKLYTDVLLDSSTDPKEGLKLLTCPLPMSMNKTSSAGGADFFVELPDLTSNTPVNVRLKRRVARFDIINTASYSNFEITNIYVTRAQKSAWLQDSFLTATDPYAGNVGSMKIPGGNANGANAAQGENEYLNEGVFYLWPTVLEKNVGVDPTTGTEILIEGKFYNTSVRTYKLMLNADQKIEANKIYKIKIKAIQDNSVEFQLMVEDWEDGVDIDTDATGQTINWTSSSYEMPDGTKVAFPATKPQNAPVIEYLPSSTKPAVIRIVTVGTNKSAGANGHTTSAKIYAKAGVTGYVQSDLDATTDPSIITSVTETTYNSMYYTTTHTISLPATDAPLETMLQIMNPVNNADYMEIDLKTSNYGKTGIKPVKVGNVLWAPVNVGATVLPANPGLFLNTDTTIFGYYFQWGRNTRFGSGTLTTTNTKFGSIDEANNSDKFYIGENTYLTTQLYDLWSGAKAQGPCPPGWRLPTQADIDALSALTKADVNPWQKVTGDDGFLYFPFAGYRANSNGAMTNWGSSYFCWGGTSVGTMVNRFWGATNSMAKPETEGLSTGFNVRAVRDIPVVTP